MKELIVASNPAKRRMSAKQRSAALRNLKKARAARRGTSVKSNPTRRKRRRSGTKRRRHAKRRNYVAARRIRSNPIKGLRKFNLSGIVDRQLMPALIAGGGAVVNDIGYGYAGRFLPEIFQTGMLRHVGKAGSAILLGYVASMLVGRRLGDQLGAGALAVVGYNVVKELLTKFGPTGLNLGMYLPMEGLGYPGAGWNPTWGGYDNTMRGQLGMYLQPLNGLRGGVTTADAGVMVPQQLSQGGESPYMRAARAAAASQNTALDEIGVSY